MTRPLLTLDLKDLKRNTASAVEFLRSRPNVSVKVKGSIVQLEIEHAREAKLILHKFLRQAELTGYRVVVVHPGLVKVEAPEEKERRKPREKGGSPPMPWETVPDQWWLTPPGWHRPGKKSKRHGHL